MIYSNRSANACCALVFQGRVNYVFRHAVFRFLMDTFFCTKEGLEVSLTVHYHLLAVNISGNNTVSILGAPRVRYRS